MAERITIEQDQHPEGTPCECSDCDWKGPIEALDAPDGAVLTPGDASPAGRCPACGSLAYVENAATKAEDAFRDLLRIKTWNPQTAMDKVRKLEAAFNAAMAGAYIRAEFQLVRGTHNVEFEDAGGHESRYAVMANDAMEAVAVAWGIRRADNDFNTRKGVEGFDPTYALEAYPENYNVDSVFPINGGADESEAVRVAAGVDFGDPIGLDDVLKAMPPFDNARAEREGWKLGTNDLDGTFGVRAVGDTFATHNAALFHVVTQAEAESPYHARALAMVGVENKRHE